MNNLDLGNRIKLARGSYNQEDLATIIGVDRSTVASWETGRREPDLATLFRIADIAEVSLDWLAGRQNAPSIQHAQAYNDPKWHKIIDVALHNKVKPEKLHRLLNAALDL